MTIAAAKTPPPEYQPFFERRYHGQWYAIRAVDIAARIDAWRYGKGRSRYWQLSPTDRRTISDWVVGKNYITWYSIERLIAWSGHAAPYWLGDLRADGTPEPLRRRPGRKTLKLPPPPKTPTAPVAPPHLKAQPEAPSPSPPTEPQPYSFFAGLL